MLTITKDIQGMFLDDMMRDAQTFREMLPTLRAILRLAYNAKLTNPISVLDNNWKIETPDYGMYENPSLVACLEWLVMRVAS